MKVKKIKIKFVKKKSKHRYTRIEQLNARKVWQIDNSKDDGETCAHPRENEMVKIYCEQTANNGVYIPTYVVMVYVYAW